MRKGLIPILMICLMFFAACKIQLAVKSSQKTVAFPGIPTSTIGITYKIKILPSSGNITFDRFILQGKDFKLNCPFLTKKDSAFTFIIIETVDPNRKKPNRYFARVSYQEHIVSCKLFPEQTDKKYSALITIFYKKGFNKGSLSINKIEDVHKIYAP